jgi:hypothetical protein
MFRKKYIEKRFSCDISKIEEILLGLGYTKKSDFFRETHSGRIHIKLNSITIDSCKLEIHHDLNGPTHFTVPFDQKPRKAYKEIIAKILLVHGKSFELL